MIIGKIDENLEARIELRVISGEQTHRVEFLVDTGFNGYLALPMSLVSSLELPLGEVQGGITADGRIGFFDTVRVQIIWHDHHYRYTLKCWTSHLSGHGFFTVTNSMRAGFPTA